jgi:hypothetical protein
MICLCSDQKTHGSCTMVPHDIWILTTWELLYNTYPVRWIAQRGPTLWISCMSDFSVYVETLKKSVYKTLSHWYQHWIEGSWYTMHTSENVEPIWWSVTWCVQCCITIHRENFDHWLSYPLCAWKGSSEIMFLHHKFWDVELVHIRVFVPAL